LSFLSILCISAFEDFNRSYKEERNIYWLVGLYTPEDSTSVPKHVAGDVHHKWCNTDWCFWIIIESP